MNKLALITGASSGIGLEIAKVMAQNGHDLILTARSKTKLEEVARGLEKQYSVKVKTVPFDLAQPRAGEGLFERLRPFNEQVEVLVNNAGFGDSGPLIEQNLSALNDMMNLNMSSLTQLCRLYGAVMAARRHGVILNVASTAAFQPGPYMAVYFATKAYVLSLSEALRVELRPFNVQVNTLCPGATVTQFQHRARVADKLLFDRRLVMPPHEVAKAAYLGMQKNRGVIVTGALNSLTATLSRFAPRAVTSWIVTRMNNSVIQKN